MTSPMISLSGGSTQRTVIVGGGAMGLAMADLLVRSGRRVTVLESATSPGGLTSATTMTLSDGRTLRWDRFYHVILTSDRRLRSLIGRLGLADRLQFSTVGSELMAGGRVHPASSVLDLARLPTLTAWQRARVAATVGVGALMPLGVRARTITAERWLTRWSGSGAGDALWRPLLEAKLGTRAGEASSVFIRSTFRRLVGARLRGGDGDRFGTVEGGWHTVLARWSEELADRGVTIRSGVRVSALVRGSTGWRIETGTGPIEADEVILTLAGPASARLLPDEVDPRYRTRLERLPYLGVVCVTLALSRRLTGGYLTYVTDQVPFTGVIEISNLTQDRALAGAHLVYLPRYCDPDDPLMSSPDDVVAEEFTAALRRCYPDLGEDDVRAVVVSRARHVMPVPTAEQGDAPPAFSTGLPGLFCAGSSQVTDGTLNVETTLRVAEDAAAVVRGAPATTALNSVATARAAATAHTVPDERPIASISLDADNLWSYLKTHGDSAWESRPSYLGELAPRVLDLFGTHGVTATVFMVGFDAAREDGAAMIAAVSAAGHEIANHSYEHEPWLHRYSRDQLDDELARTEAAIESAGAERPRGFRGPGYSLSPDLVELLAERGYDYDASTLPTWIGPLARAYYFRSTALAKDQRAERSLLFGSAREGLRPVAPYRWRTRERDDLVELPVTTVPVLRTPFHVSYVLQLHAIRPALARAYLATALRACRAAGVGPSILLHPLDLLGREHAPGLEFFPGMSLSAREKAQVVGETLGTLQASFRLVGTGEHVRSISAPGKVVPAGQAGSG